ncbi:MAG: hypothetical protein ABH951_00465 [Patescibacteria group bacterium]
MKKIILILVLMLSFFTARVIHAVPAAPSPTCEINADVLKVKKDNNYYNVTLNITKISTDQQEGDILCDNSYINIVKSYNYTLLFSDEYKKTPIYEGQKIQTKIHFEGDERFHGYFISNIKILEDVQKVRSNYWYYIIPAGLGLLVSILFMIFKKKN